MMENYTQYDEVDLHSPVYMSRDRPYQTNKSMGYAIFIYVIKNKLFYSVNTLTTLGKYLTNTLTRV